MTVGAQTDLAEDAAELPAAGSPRTLRWFTLLFLIPAALVAGAVAVGRRHHGAKRFDPRLLVHPKVGDLEVDVLEMGKIQPRERVEVKSKVAGQVDRVLVSEGERVKVGQLLLTLDPTDYQREVARAEGELQQAKIAVTFARATLERRKSALAARATTAAEVEAAESDLRSKVVGVTLASVALAAAQDKLRYTRIVSPMDGVVIERGIQPGEVVTPGVQATFEGKALLTLADLGSLRVNADLNQIDAAKIKVGDEALVTLDALPGRTYHARVTKTAAAAVTPKGKDIDVFPIEATLQDPDRNVKPGMTADLRVRLETKRSVLLLPIEAVVANDDLSGGADVWVLSNGAGEPFGAERRAVTIGSHNERSAEIQSGLSVNDVVLMRAGDEPPGVR